MQAMRKAEFSASTLTGIVEASNPNGVLLYFVLKTHSGNQSGKGYMSVISPGGGSRQVHMQLAIHPDYHDVDILNEIREATFNALGIPLDATWKLHVSPACMIEMLSDEIEDGYIEFL